MNVFHCGALILCWTPLCVALHVSHGHQLIQDPTLTETGGALENQNAPRTSSASTGSSHTPLHPAPCFVDDMLDSLREGLGSDSQLTNGSLPPFGICASTDPLSRSLLVELAQETSGSNRLKFAHPTEVLATEEGKSGVIRLTFEPPRPPLPELQPVLLLAFESPVKAGTLDVTFTSQWLQPDAQSVCFSEETQYILLPGNASQINIQQKWTLSAETRSHHMKQSLKDILIGGNSDSNPSMASLLLYLGERGTNTRNTQVSDSSPASSQTFSFLCELKRLLGDLLPQSQPASPALQLETIHSQPPVKISTSSNETLLAGLISSTALTVFSYSGWRPAFPQLHHGELSLSAALLEELAQRLQHTVAQIQTLIREEDIDDRAPARLRRLKELSAFPQQKPVPGERQYRAFLMVKALQSVARTYELQRALRATRADPSGPGGSCGLRNLSVSLSMHFASPTTANIKNCQGHCTPPSSLTNNHAHLLYVHIENGGVGERALCCVPVAYDELQVVEISDGAYMHIKKDMVAKECGCR
ncbi:muellerian-inhibiting factor [Betta splendens]|uniref:Muellerian-inhibiting factor n=1 Tax=Betta splendens TaxID=158456 RepID=A0A6P7M9L4_BETSP|nr:muellerian-inhibiting factor [Betta splendens]